MKISYSALAVMISRQCRVDVVCQGDTARTEHVDDKFRIYLPNITDESLMPVMLGFAWHEIGHVKWSDFNLFPKNQLLMTLTNILEDVRIESLMTRDYPGTYWDLKRTIEYVFEDYEPADSLCGECVHYILYKCRGLTSFAEQSRSIIPGTLANKIDVTLTPAYRQVQSTQDCIDLAQRLYDLLEEEYGPQSQVQDSEQGDGDGASNGDSDGQNSQSSESSSSSSLSSSRSLPSSKDLDSTDLAKRITVLSQVAAKDYAANSSLNADIKEDSSSGGGILTQLSSAQIHKACAAASRLARAFLSLVQAYRLNFINARRTGVVNTKALYRLSLNDNRVFSRKVIQQDINAHVTVLLDGSGSMDGRPAELASMAGYAVTKALRQIPGVTTEQFVFFHYSVRPMIKANENLANASTFIASASGCTPLGAAYAALLGRCIAIDPLKKRIIIVVTDGQIDDEELFAACLNAAKWQRIVTYGIGIDTSAPSSIGVERSVTIRSLEELPEALFSIMRGELCTRG